MINLQEIVKNSLSQLYETMWPLLLLLVCASIVAFYLSKDFSRSNRERRKLKISFIDLLIIPFLATLVYLIINEYFILLFLLFAILIIYIMYKIGLLDTFLY